MRYLTALIFTFTLFNLPAQEAVTSDTAKIKEYKGTLSLTKKDDGIHAFRYLFSKTKQNKSSYLKFGERILYSTSFVWIAESEYYKENWLHTFTWYNSVSLNISKSLYFGVHYLAIHTRGSLIYEDKESENFGIYGFVFQYDLLPRFDNRLYIESSIDKGDFCFCRQDDPHRVPNLLYWGVGLGYDFPVYKRISFRMGFTNYLILTAVKDKSNFTQYVLGLNINLGKNSYRSDISFLELFN